MSEGPCRTLATGGHLAGRSQHKPTVRLGTSWLGRGPGVTVPVLSECSPKLFFFRERLLEL